MLIYQGKNYSRPFVAEHGVCQPGRTYRWGFSSAILCLLSIFQVLWVSIMWAIWAHARMNSHVAREGYTSAPYRAALALSKAIRHEIGGECDVLSEKGLQLRLHPSGNGMILQRAAVDSLEIGVELNQLLSDNEANKSTNQSTNTSPCNGRGM